MSINESSWYKCITLKTNCLAVVTEQNLLGFKLIQFFNSPLIQENKTYQRKNKHAGKTSFKWTYFLILLTI